MYANLLKKLGIYSLEKQRLREDLIKAYKIFTWKEKEDKDKFFMPVLNDHELHGQTWKLFKPSCKSTIKCSFFSNRVINVCNSLPQHVVNATSINMLKNRLDKTWKERGSCNLPHYQQVQVQVFFSNINALLSVLLL